MAREARPFHAAQSRLYSAVHRPGFAAISICLLAAIAILTLGDAAFAFTEPHQPALPKVTATPTPAGSPPPAAIPTGPTTGTVSVDGRPVAAGRILVQYQEDASLSERANVHQRAAQAGVAGARAVRALGRGGEVVDVRGAPSLEVALAVYRADPRVRYAGPDHVVMAAETPNDYWYNRQPQVQWALPLIGAPSAWDRTHGSASVLVAVLDSGIRADHPDLAGKVVASANFSDSPDAVDRYGHGTHVAGIVAASTNNGEGVASLGYNTRLLNGKVLGDTGNGQESSLIDSTYWAIAQGAKVINISLGYLGEISPLMQAAIDDAWAGGIVVVAAAGNNSTNQHFAPASGNHVLAVANTTSVDAIESRSNYGTWVDLAAPGTGILSTWPVGGGSQGYEYSTGTSMASPHVSALAALLWTTGWGTSPQVVVDRIGSTANRIAGTGSYWQYGRIDAAAAVVPPVPSPTATNTPTPTHTATPTSTSTATPTATATQTATPGPVLSTQTVSLHSGWNWLSIGVQSADTAVSSVLSSISGRFDYVLGESGTYAPAPANPSLNTLTAIEPGKGYMIRMKEAASLAITGQTVLPSTPILLTEGWHWIGYLGAGSAALPDVLSSVSGSYDYLIGEDGTYSPTGLPFLNTISALHEGAGYLIRMNKTATLRYSP